MNESTENRGNRNLFGPDPDAPGLARRVLGFRVPLWSALAVVILVAGLFGFMAVSGDSVDLGDAVDGAVDSSVSLTVCNETVDRREINPRTAELDLKEGLEDLGVKRADVRVNRIDCGADAP